jgi:DNA-binding NarL/FixJ family response regulator
MSIRILVADDHQLMREGLHALLDSQSDMMVVDEACNGRDVVAKAARLTPDIVLMDIGMPELNGIDATRQIGELAKPPRIIALSMHADRQFVQGVLRAGATGYLLKDSAFEELADAVRRVADGQVYLSPAIAGVVVESLQSDSGNGLSHDTLTAREREVLQLMSEGHSTKEIARQLHISVKTVETHRRQVMRKLDIFSVAELTKYAIRNGLTKLE